VTLPGRKQVRRSRNALLTRTRLLALFALFIVVGLGIYSASFRGPFLADDLHYIPQNPYVTDPSAGRLLEVLDPTGQPVVLVHNYSPVHLLLHAAEYQLFGTNTLGYHLVNVLLHALASALLVLLLRRSGVADTAALLGGAFFLVHPANVEAVAWISQLKTSSALVLTLLALLALERRPALSTFAFGLGLLAKPTAALALPVAAVLGWLRRTGRSREQHRRTLLWLGVWSAVFAAFAVAEMLAVERTITYVEPIDPDPWVRLRSSVALVARYLEMAATSRGLSAFHEPGPALSPLDLGWLAGLSVIAAISVRTLVALREGREEAAWWIWAAVAFLPVSQIFPFPYPLADRYLYPILPGLIGGTLLAAQSLRPRLPLHGSWPARVGAVVAIAVLATLTLRAHDRARIWAVPALVLADAAAHYPDGVHGHLLRARRHVENGRRQEAVASLRAAYQRGFDGFEQILQGSAFQHLRGDPDFDAVIHDMAGHRIELFGRRANPSQAEIFAVGIAHHARGEIDLARRAYEQVLEQPGPLNEHAQRALAELPSRGSTPGKRQRRLPATGGGAIPQR
jgi:hypothetical protein